MRELGHEPTEVANVRLLRSELRRVDAAARDLGFTRSQWLRNWICSSFEEIHQKDLDARRRGLVYHEA